MSGPAGRMAEGSPRGKARMTGAAFLPTVLLGGVGESVHGRLVLPGDAAATATNILAWPRRRC
ncbi:MAG TPA: hypothetical protein VH700_16715 [Gemmatimonadales bacterium]